MKNEITISIKQMQHAEGLPLPHHATEGAAGMDAYAAIHEAIVIPPGQVRLVPTGLQVAIPLGYEMQVRSRSGLAAKNSVFCLNSPGTIDSDYRGEIQVILANFSQTDFMIQRGDRIGQFVVARHEHVTWQVQEELSATVRGEGGFGSTGVTL